MKKGIVEGLDFFGQGILRENGKCLFLNNGLPGETVEYTATVSKKHFAKGRVTKITKESPHRLLPPCPYYGQCGGCSFQHCDEETELTAKENHIKNTIQRIGGCKDFHMLPLARQRPLYHYRNKVTWHMRRGKTGFYKKGSNQWIPIDCCMLLAEPLEIVTDTINTMNLEYDGSIMLRTNEKGEVFVVFHNKVTENAKMLMAQCSQVKGMEIAGKQLGIIPQISLGEYIYEVTPGSFFQVNLPETEIMISTIREKIFPPNEHGILLDLYCGVGALGIGISDRFQEIYGIESYADAAKVAQNNARRNGIHGHYIAAKTEEALESLVRPLQSKAFTVVVDPPRAGLAPKAAQFLSQCGAHQIIYVSCDPATLSRDLRILRNHYQIKSVRPFNLFPRTAHCETVVTLIKQGGDLLSLRR